MSKLPRSSHRTINKSYLMLFARWIVTILRDGLNLISQPHFVELVVNWGPGNKILVLGSYDLTIVEAIHHFLAAGDDSTIRDQNKLAIIGFNPLPEWDIATASPAGTLTLTREPTDWAGSNGASRVARYSVSLETVGVYAQVYPPPTATARTITAIMDRVETHISTSLPLDGYPTSPAGVNRECMSVAAVSQ